MNKLFTKIAALFLGMTMAVGVGVAVGTKSRANQVDATPTTYNFSSIPTKGWTTNGGSQTINSISWTYSSSTYIGANGSRIQVGSSKKPQTSNWTIQTPVSSFGQNKKITAVGITAYTTATTATYDISVGGTSVKSGSLTTSSDTYSASSLNVTAGNIIVTLTGSSSSKAMYLSDISVTYEDNTSTKTLSSVSTSGQTETFSDGASFAYGGTLTATYDKGEASEETKAVTPTSFKYGAAGLDPTTSQAVTAITVGTALSHSTHNGKTIYVLYTESTTTVYTSYVITVNEPQPSVEITTSEEYLVEGGASGSFVATITNNDGYTITWSASPSTGVSFSPATTTSGQTVTVSFDGTTTGTTPIQITATLSNTAHTASSPVSVYSFAHAGTETDPFSATDADIFCNANYLGKSGGTWYVQGYVVGEYRNSQDKLTGYYIDEDKTASSSKKFEVYNNGGIAHDDVVVGTSYIKAHGSMFYYSTGNQSEISSAVIDEVTNPTLTSVALEGDMTKKEYDVGDDWDYSGLKIEGYYNDNSHATLSSDIAASVEAGDLIFDVNYSKATSTSITSLTFSNIAWGEDTVLGENRTITDIIVNALPEVTGVVIGGDMTNKTYHVGDDWNYAGITVTISYDTKADEVFNLTDLITSGDIEFTATPNKPALNVASVTLSAFTYIGYSGQIDGITINGISVSSYDNATKLAPGNYYIKYGSSYLTGVSSGKGSLGAKADAIVFTFALVGNDTWEVTNGSDYLYINDSSTGLKLDSSKNTLSIGWVNETNSTRYLRGAGNRDIAYYSGSELRTYKNVTDGTNGMTLESAKVVSGFSVDTTNANKNVLKGTDFTASIAQAAGFQARLNYTDSTFDDVTLSATWTLDTSTEGTATLTVTYQSYAAVEINDMNIYVVTIVSLTIDSSGAKTTGYWTGDTLDTTGLVITGLDSSDNEHPIAISDCSFSPTTLSTAGSQTITATYTNEDESTAKGTYTVTVTAYAYQIASSINGGDRVIFTSTDTYKKFLSAGTGTATSYTDKPGTEYYLDVVAGINDGTVAFKDPTGQYLNGATAKALSLSDSVSEETSWTVAFDGTTPTITNVYDTENVLKYNTSSPVFRAYANDKATFMNVYKLIGASGQEAAETWATSFNTDVVNGVCKPNGSNFDTAMPAAWSAKASTYSALSEEAKAYIASKNPNAAGDVVEKALYEYNHIYSTYGTALELDNFIGRIEPTKVTAAPVIPLTNILNGENSNMVAIVVIVSVVSLTVIGGYFFLKKRREQN